MIYNKTAPSITNFAFGDAITDVIMRRTKRKRVASSSSSNDGPLTLTNENTDTTTTNEDSSSSSSSTASSNCNIHIETELTISLLNSNNELDAKLEKELINEDCNTNSSSNSDEQTNQRRSKRKKLNSTSNTENLIVSNELNINIQEQHAEVAGKTSFQTKRGRGRPAKRLASESTSTTTTVITHQPQLTSFIIKQSIDITKEPPASTASESAQIENAQAASSPLNASNSEPKVYNRSKSISSKSISSSHSLTRRASSNLQRNKVIISPPKSSSTTMHANVNTTTTTTTTTIQHTSTTTTTTTEHQSTVNNNHCIDNYCIESASITRLDTKQPAPTPPSKKPNENASSDENTPVTPLSLIDHLYGKRQSAKLSESENDVTNECDVPLPLLTWASNYDLWKVMKDKEQALAHDVHCLRRHHGIEPQMRAILLDWLLEICFAYRLHRETFHLACEYIDRFFTVRDGMSIDRLQLIGMTALFVAAKVEEIYPPKLRELASHMEEYSANNEEAISQFELFMLKALSWEISPVTVNTWVNTYLQIAHLNASASAGGSGEASAQTTKILLPQYCQLDYVRIMTLVDLCVFDMESLRFKYSELAAAAMFLMGSSSEAALKSSGFSVSEIEQCVAWMSPYAEVVREFDAKIQIQYFSNVDPDDAHNIQLYYEHLDLLKEAQLRKTPSKFYSLSSANLVANVGILTPPDSNKKNSVQYYRN